MCITRLIKTAIKTVLRSDNKAIYSKIINNRISNSSNGINKMLAIKTTAIATVIAAAAAATTITIIIQRIRVVDRVMHDHQQ